MKNSEIITLNNYDSTLAIPTFKDDRLNKATQHIATIYRDASKYAETKNREIAKILAEVADKKSYESDGFKSVADYAMSTFGIARQNAYALANAGKVYNDKSANTELQAMTPSKLAEIAAVSPDIVSDAISSGAISKNSTQSELREFASKNRVSNDPTKPVVLDKYTAHVCAMSTNTIGGDELNIPKILDDWDDYFMGIVQNVARDQPIEVIKLPNGKVDPNAKKSTVLRKLYLAHSYCLAVELYKHVEPKSNTKDKTKKSPKFTREQLEAMLAEMDTNN